MRSAGFPHPHEGWNRERLEGYVGTTEALTLEFKSYRALVPDNQKDRAERIRDVSKDVAGMANEQGGSIIFGLDEAGDGPFRRAVAVEEGFSKEHGVSREWLLQIMRDHINPPLTELDAVDVPLNTERSRFALVALVPQARGVARQTDDMLFWRRDAQGLRPMTVQEIEDIRSRRVRPDLELSITPSEASNNEVTHANDLNIDFRVTNVSEATASFCVITVGFLFSRVPSVGNLETGWRRIENDGEWRIRRCVVASGSSEVWSPLTPGFTLVHLGFRIRILTPAGGYLEDYLIGVARLDHDGGSRLYKMGFSNRFDPQFTIKLSPMSEDDQDSLADLRVPDLFGSGWQ